MYIIILQLPNSESLPAPLITIWAPTHILPNVPDISASTCPKKKKKFFIKMFPSFLYRHLHNYLSQNLGAALASSLASSSLSPPVYINHPDLSVLPPEYFSEFPLLISATTALMSAFLISLKLKENSSLVCLPSLRSSSNPFSIQT